MSETSPTLGLAPARDILDAARRAAQDGSPLALEAVDAGGHRVAFMRMDGTMLAAIHTVPASTAVRLGARTTPFVRQAPADPAGTLSACRAAGLVVSAGAIPLELPAGIAGAVGASGGRAEEDERASRAGASAWRRRVGAR